MLFIEPLHAGDRFSAREKRGDDRPGAGTVDKVEAAPKWLLNQRLNLKQHAERIKALGPAAIQGKHAKWSRISLSGVRIVPDFCCHVPMCPNEVAHTVLR